MEIKHAEQIVHSLQHLIPLRKHLLKYFSQIYHQVVVTIHKLVHYEILSHATIKSVHQMVIVTEVLFWLAGAGLTNRVKYIDM